MWPAVTNGLFDGDCQTVVLFGLSHCTIAYNLLTPTLDTPVLHVVLLIPPLLQLFESMVFSILILVIVVIVTYSVHHRQKLHG